MGRGCTRQEAKQAAALHLLAEMGFRVEQTAALPPPGADDTSPGTASPSADKNQCWGNLTAWRRQYARHLLLGKALLSICLIIPCEDSNECAISCIQMLNSWSRSQFQQSNVTLL